MTKSRMYMCRPPLPPRARGVDCNKSLLCGEGGSTKEVNNIIDCLPIIV